TADGVALSAAAGLQETPVAVADGTGGMLVGWADARGADRDVYAQRVSGAGVVQWTMDGVGLCAAAGEQRAPVLCGDGANGALVGWQDGRPGALGQDVYAQRVSGAGVVQWVANGVGVCTAAADQVGPAIAADPLGGAVVAWSDARTVANGADIYVQHLSLAGGVLWTANGVWVCDAANAQDGALVIADGQGGALAAWRDLRAGTTSDLYSQRVDASGQIPAQCVATTLLADNSPVTASSAQSYYTVEMQDFYWTGVGVRSAAGSDWDLEMYAPGTFGLNPYPTCFSDPLAGSFASSGVDFVVGDFNIGHTPPIINTGNGYGVRAFRYAGAGNGTVEWDDGPDYITKDCNGGACGGTSGNNWSGVLDVWDVYLFANQTYTFDFTRTGSADIKLLLFSSAGTTGPFVVPRSARVFETTNSSTVIAAPASGYYGVVLVNDNGLSGTYLVRVVTGIPTIGVGEAPGPVTGLRGVAPNPSAGRVQIQFALREPGAVAFEVLDMAGRVVARIPGRRWEAGTWSVGWDGRSSRGTPAAPGIYFVQMRVDERRVGLGRLALIR
ncbi:MAG: FlgD immunoglobulin-like domain containing protein, partial [Candidatus Eisenbacteria bacterium]